MSVLEVASVGGEKGVNLPTRSLVHRLAADGGCRVSCIRYPAP